MKKWTFLTTWGPVACLKENGSGRNIDHYLVVI